jgi:uncharacterized protein DUF6457
METTLYDWAVQANAALGLPQEASWVSDRDTVEWVLDLARDVAHGVARPAAPLGAFLAGVCVGLAGAQERHQLAQIHARLAATLADGGQGDGP